MITLHGKNLKKLLILSKITKVSTQGSQQHLSSNSKGHRG
jgi:hypothetical protein